MLGVIDSGPIFTMELVIYPPFFTSFIWARVIFPGRAIFSVERTALLADPPLGCRLTVDGIVEGFGYFGFGCRRDGVCVTTRAGVY